MFKIFSNSVVTALFLLTTGGSLQAQSDSGQIKGTVVDNSSSVSAVGQLKGTAEDSTTDNSANPSLNPTVIRLPYPDIDQDGGSLPAPKPKPKPKPKP